MASWASRQRAKYIFFILLFFVVLVGIPIFLVLYDSPTCFDGKQNGDEEGIDCGGACELVCSFEAVSPIILWTRLFEVLPGVYSVVALVENPNFDVGAEDVPYVFKIRDERNILIFERKGTTFIPPKQVFPIFETRIIAGEREPRRAFFEFPETPRWETQEQTETNLAVTERAVSATSTSPRLDAKIENRGRRDVSQIQVVAILYDENDNAIAASETTLDFLSRGESADLVFTWPTPFTASPARIDVIPKVHPVK